MTVGTRDAGLREHRYPKRNEGPRTALRCSLFSSPYILLRQFSVSPDLWTQQSIALKLFSLGLKSPLKHQYTFASCILHAPSVSLVAASANPCDHARSYRHMHQYN